MRPRLVPLLAALALMSTGCGTGTDSPAGVAKSTTSAAGSLSSTANAPSLPAYDPPRQFASSPVSIGHGKVAVADGVAYSYSDTGLVAVDLATGSRRWSVQLPGASHLVSGPMSEGEPPGIVTDDKGQQLVVAAYYNTTTGTGTQQDSDHTQVVAVDTAGKIRWQVGVQPASLTPRVVGELHDGRSSAVVLDVHDTVVLDTASGSVRWSGQRVKPAGVDGDKVMGVRAADRTDPWTAVALRGSDGGQLWAGPALTGATVIIGTPPTLTLASPGRAILVGRSEESDDKTMVLDTATGKPVATIPESLTCLFDERDTVVCSKPAQMGELSELVIGMDPASGKQLWKLPDNATRRTAVDVTTVFHGAVYGRATHTSVILDVRTGADMVTDSQISPEQVLPGYGIVVSLDDDMPAVAYRATA